MANQSGRNVLVAFGVESVFNTPPAAGVGKRFRLNPGQGPTLVRALIRSNEVRSDLKTSRPRMGSQSVTGSLPADLSLSTFDPLIEAALRGTWTASVAITQATMTSITTGTNTIVAAAGSWITQGVRVGDVVRLTGHSTAANNSRNLRVTGVTASTITVAETIIADAVADTSFTLTVARKVTQPSVPVRRSFTFEEYDQDIDQTEQATGCRIGSMHITGAPDGMCIIDFGIMGADLNPLATGSSPFYTAPTLTSTIALTMVDASLRFAGADILTLTAFDCTLDNHLTVQPVIGSVVPSDVYDGAATLDGSISAIRADLTNITRLRAETELELHALLVEPETEPKDFISLFVPALKLTGVNKSLGSDGPYIETLPWTAGNKDATTGYDDTMLMIGTSAP